MNWRIIFVLPLFCACTGQQARKIDQVEGEVTTENEKDVADSAHNSRISLDWAGTYQGTLPCEDCEGVETRITLKKSGKYAREEKYLGKSNTPLMGAGVFEWNEEGSTVTLKSPSGNDKTYKVVEKGLIFYKGGDEPAETERFLLEKNITDPDLEDRKWVLTELNGKRLSEYNFGAKPYLKFNSVEARMSGNASCNDFFGRYEFHGNNRITMGEKMGLTRKNCEDNTLEEKFIELLKTANEYKIADGNLTLMNDEEGIAKFKISRVSA